MKKTCTMTPPRGIKTPCGAPAVKSYKSWRFGGPGEPSIVDVKHFLCAAHAKWLDGELSVGRAEALGS